MNKGRMSQRGLLLLLLLLLLSIESMMSRGLSTDEWQQLAGTGANVLSDTILPCVESDSCRGRIFGSMSEDVSKFGNVPPCRFHGWVRCVAYPGTSTIDVAHSHQQNKDSFSQQQRPYNPLPASYERQLPQENAVRYLSKAVRQDRPNEPPRFVSSNTQNSFAHQLQQQQQQQQQRSAFPQSVAAIPKHAELQRGGAVQFQQHPDAVLLPPVNKPSVEHWGNQPVAERSRPESQGLTQAIQRSAEFQLPHKRFEQSSQLINPSKFSQQQQLTQNEFLGNNFVESRQTPHKQEPTLQFRQLTQPTQQTFKTWSSAHHPVVSSQQFLVETQQRPFVQVDPMPVESQRLTSASEGDKSFQRMPQRVEPIHTNFNPSFRLIEAGQQIIDPRRFTEPPSQLGEIEPQQRFERVNQPAKDPIKKEHPQQIVKEAQRLPQANQQLVELQRPPKPFVGHQPIPLENAFQQNKEQRPMEPQRSAEPRGLEPPPLVKSNLLGESPQFVAPAKSTLENLFQFNSLVDSQLAREQLADLIRLLAQSASQENAPNEETFGVTTPKPHLIATSKSQSNIVPFITFSEPLPLEPTSSNSLF